MCVFLQIKFRIFRNRLFVLYVGAATIAHTNVKPQVRLYISHVNVIEVEAVNAVIGMLVQFIRGEHSLCLSASKFYKYRAM